MRSPGSSAVAAWVLVRALVLGPVLSVSPPGTAFAQPPATPPSGEKQVSIAGEVRNSLTLAPVERAHVSVRKFVNGKWDRYGVLTSAEGKFLIANLPAGTYTIFADRSGYTDLTPPSAREMKLGPGEKKEDFKLKLTPTGEITGRALDRDGAPMEGLLVQVESGGQTHGLEITDDRGMFRLGGLAPGKYRVLAQPPKHIATPPEIRTDGTAEVHYSPTYYPGALSAKDATKVTVPAGGAAAGLEIRVVSTPILRVSGRVSGFPPGAQNVNVSLSRSAGVSGAGARAGPDGRFEIWRVDPGKYTLRGYYNSAGPPMASAPLEVEIGDTDVENLAVQLMAPVEIRGVVEFEDDDTRRFMHPARAQIQPPGTNGQPQKPPLRYVMLRDASSNVAASGEMQEDGSFVLARVQPGVYGVTISPGPVYVKAMEFGEAHVAGAQLDLRSGAAGALTLHMAMATGAIGGVIRDEKGPVATVVMVAIVEADAQKASPVFGTVKADGSYSLGAVPPGKYRIVAYEEGDLVWGNEDREDIGEVIEVRDRDVVTKDLKVRAAGGAK